MNTAWIDYDFVWDEIEIKFELKVEKKNEINQLPIDMTVIVSNVQLIRPFWADVAVQNYCFNLNFNLNFSLFSV